MAIVRGFIDQVIIDPSPADGGRGGIELLGDKLDCCVQPVLGRQPDQGKVPSKTLFLRCSSIQ